MKYLIIAAFFAVILLTISCESEKREPIEIPDEVTFKVDVIPIFAENCIKCHDGTTPPDLTPENAYFDLTNGNYLNLDDPENSYLYQKISGNGSMAQFASDKDRAVILRWIELGAEDN